MTLLDKFTADTELQKFRKRGYSAYIFEYTTESGKVIYKIRSGKYANRSSAVAAAKEYQAKEGAAAMVVTASDDAPAGKAQPAQKAAVPDPPEEKKTAGGKKVTYNGSWMRKNPPARPAFRKKLLPSSGVTCLRRIKRLPHRNPATASGLPSRQARSLTKNRLNAESINWAARAMRHTA